MIKRSLKRIAKILLVAAVAFTIGCTTAPTTAPTTGVMHFKNKSDCILFAVTVGKMTVSDVTGGYDYELVIGEWLPVGMELDVELIIGQQYCILLQAYRFSEDDKLNPTEHLSDILKPGVFKGKEDSVIDLHCKHSEPRDA